MKKQKLLLIIALALLIAACTVHWLTGSSNSSSKNSRVGAAKVVQKNYCAKNTESKVIIVSIEQRHLWACEGINQVYNSAIVTGDMNITADATPIGTFKIYAKEADRYLSGSDEKGSWNVHVDYWMPFLDNQYGTFGFHDADWRKDKDFGRISPYSTSASHGCVELPPETAHWLYGWSAIGTSVVVTS